MIITNDRRKEFQPYSINILIESEADQTNIAMALAVVQNRHAAIKADIRRNSYQLDSWYAAHRILEGLHKNVSRIST